MTGRELFNNQITQQKLVTSWHDHTFYCVTNNGTLGIFQSDVATCVNHMRVLVPAHNTGVHL